MSTTTSGLSGNLRNSFGFLILCTSVFCSGCFQHYYSIHSSRQIDSTTMVSLIQEDKYFVVHDYYHKTELALYHPKLSGDVMEADAGPILSEHTPYLNPTRPDHNRFPVQYESIVLNEVHLYSRTPINDTGHLSIPLKNFDRVDVYQLDKKSTNKSTAGSIVGITLSTAAAVGIIIAVVDASKTEPAVPAQTVSCSPQVYITENDQTELQGTLYSGALYASLERADYLPLHLSPATGDKLQVSLQGKKEEDIFIRDVQLMQVTHSENESALIDRKGEVLIYKDPVAPDQAITGDHQQAIQEIKERDGNYYSFTNHSKGGNSSDIILDFKKPRGVSHGKLIVHAKNSSWSYYLFSQFKSLYGDAYPALLQRKDKADPKKVLQCELDQSLPLLVYVKDKEDWKFVDYFPTSGNTRARDLIMNLDLSDFSNSDHIQIRLQTTFLFWDLDYAGMDFSQENTFQTTVYAAGKKYTETPGINPVVCEVDSQSTFEIDHGEQLKMDFTIRQEAGNGLKNSYFLMGKGYYHDNTVFEGGPHYGELLRFAGKGAFDKYSREKFEVLVKQYNDQNKTEIVLIK